ncbi:hypothetical protein BT63DRAFT_423101 [Microthyrium microscopicum]|uniref:Uncharacterized protein n=1 Tax=Microthyrium microscopicum TaxID=703497 RepID=A0A6A6UEU7_9PEZI|nr:hypothetical protein BT63DRAFT_423101 [Microthyrium microscopicum]
MAEDWKAAITFSDRLNHTVEITAAYKAAHPELDSKEASTAARNLETTIFNDAKTLVISTVPRHPSPN